MVVGQANSQPIVIGLYDNDVGQTVENFKAICRGNKKDKDGNTLTYKNTVFSTIYPDMVAIGGNNSPDSGLDGTSTYDKPFPNENMDVPKTGENLVAMAPSKEGQNGSTFGLFKNYVQINGYDVQVFGEIVSGQDVFK